MIRTGVGPAAVLVLMAAAAACRDATPLATGTGADPVPVAVAEVALETIDVTVRAVGTLTARRAVTIRPEASGIVAELVFEEGRPVAAGGVLVRLDAAKAQAERELAEARLAAARARLANAEARHRRAASLHEQEMLSSQELEDSVTELESARAAVGEAEAALRLSRRLHADMTLHAPFAGIAGKRLVDAGDFVERGQALLDLVDLEELEIAFTLPEVHLSRLRAGQAVRLEVTSLPGEDFRGEVFFVAPRVDPVNRSVELKARIDNQGRQLRPGQFAHVRLTLERREGVPVVPEEAIASREGRFFVFVVENGAAREREVRLGERQKGRVGILEGLSGGETVVRAGHQRLGDGAPVEVMPASPVSS